MSPRHLENAGLGRRRSPLPLITESGAAWAGCRASLLHVRLTGIEEHTNCLNVAPTWILAFDVNGFCRSYWVR
jgi:hypothetical protein